MYLSDCDEFHCRPTIVFLDIFIPLDHEILLLDHQIEWSSFTFLQQITKTCADLWIGANVTGGVCPNWFPGGSVHRDCSGKFNARLICISGD
jgi:hypothetical protein